MAQLTIYDLETNARLDKGEYSFRAGSREFRLVRGNELEYHALYTIIKNLDEEEQAYETVLRLCDQWSWNWKTGVCCVGQCGYGFPEGIALKEIRNLRNAARARNGSVVSIDRLPKLITEEQAIALSLRNQALCAESPFLKFLSYWRILELPYPSGPTDGKPEDRAKRWIDNIPPSKVSIPDELANALQGRALGHYLWHECRSAIVHLRGHPLHPSRAKDILKINRALDVVQSMAEEFMWSELKIDQHVEVLSILKSKKRRGTNHNAILTHDVGKRDKVVMAKQSAADMKAGRYTSLQAFAKKRRLI